MVDTSVYCKYERCVVWSYGEQDRSDQTPEEGVDVGMEAAELILVDEAPDISKGIEVMLPNLGAADSAHEFTDARVGRVAVWIFWMT